jgi:cyclophilin family peptidyl-prolyl cis-trans isomerase
LNDRATRQGTSAHQKQEVAALDERIWATFQRLSDGQGFAAFGKVIKGMDVVKRIHEQTAEEQSLKPRSRSWK